jgi:conjugative transfer region protein TrbK
MAMSPFKWLRLLAVVGIGVTLLSACVVQLRSNQGKAAAPQSSTTSDAFDTRLTWCRTVTSQQAVAFAQCRQIWADNRRRFFGNHQPRLGAPNEHAPDPVSGSRSMEETK